MKTESSPARRQMLEARIHLLEHAAADQLDELLCPDCGQNRVSVWYTHPTACDYRTWLVCENFYALRASGPKLGKAKALFRET